MNILTSGLSRSGEAIHGVTSSLGKSVQDLANTDRSVNDSDKIRNSTLGSASSTAPQTTTTSQHRIPGGGLFSSIASGVTTSVLAPTADALKSGAALSRDATRDGVSIGQKIAKSGLDMGSSVATGTANLAGTAVGGVVAVAAETSGAVFEPVGSGLKAIEGLNRLGEEGFEAINGLSLGAIRQVGHLTTKALNMSGKTPTFFDPDADGIVAVPDTVRGLVLLGLNEKNAKYAAYALHAIFSYPTSEKWIPEFNTALPIRVKRMERTRLGRNWGTFERIDWVDDVEIDKFFVDNKDEKQWSDYWKQGRQAFGFLLLLFEWGTTWPFYMPPIPVQEIPFSDDIGMVVRRAILPTILSNFRNAREADPDAKNKPATKVPSEAVPTDPKDA